MARLEARRRLAGADVPAVAALVERASAAKGHPVLGEEQRLALEGRTEGGFAGLLARSGGSIRAYAQAARVRSSWTLGVVVDPDEPASGALVTDLVGAAIGEIAAQGGGPVHLWAPVPGPEDDSVAAANGFEPERDLFQMRRDLPVDPAGERLPTRGFRPGVDEEAWLDVNNRAFAGHPEQGGWNAEALTAREREPWFDPDGFRLHDADGRIAAFCWTKLHGEPGPPLGEIYAIGVDPDYQGRGLGRMLTLSGLDWIWAAGVHIAGLYVDSANVAAVGLYRRLGFEVDHVDRAYCRRVAPRSPT